MAEDKRNKNRGRNPANESSELFKKLTRLFSGPLVNYRSQDGIHARDCFDNGYLRRRDDNIFCFAADVKHQMPE